jgi:hypothetical protein
MDMGLAEFREFISIRVNVHRSVASLELCWSCQRICECKKWFMNAAVPICLCSDCVGTVSCRLEERTGLPLSMEENPQSRVSFYHSHSEDSQKFPMETAIEQIWVRECPRCKAPIQKEQPSDSWKCPRCGCE